MQTKCGITGEGFGPRGNATLTVEAEIPFDMGYAEMFETQAITMTFRAMKVTDPNYRKLMSYGTNSVYIDGKRTPILRGRYQPRYKDAAELENMVLASPETLKKEFEAVYNMLLYLGERAKEAYRVKTLFDAVFTSRSSASLYYNIDKDSWTIEVRASRYDLPEAKDFKDGDPMGYVKREYTLTDAEAAEFTNDKVAEEVSSILAQVRSEMEEEKLMDDFKLAVAAFKDNFRLTSDFETFIQDADTGKLLVIRSYSNFKDYPFKTLDELKTLVKTVDIEVFFKLAREWDLLPKPKPAPTAEEAKANAAKRAKKKSAAQAKKDLEEEWTAIAASLNQ